MTGLSPKLLRTAVHSLCASVLAASSIAFAQESQPAPPPADQQQQATPNNGGGWPSAGAQDGQQQPPQGAPPNDAQPAPTNQAPPNQAPQYQVPQNQAPQYGQRPYGNQPYPQYGQNGQQPGYQAPYPRQAPPPIPAELTVLPGTFVTVRINQRLSSDHNQKGDTFTATLVEPVVVNGVVVAEPGETLAGVVVDAQKGGTQKLVVQLTDLTLVDGQRIPLQTELIARRGTGRNAQDAGTIVGTTALGAAVGAIAGGGPGAAVGAGAGVFLGALVTHDHPSVVYPEQILTFRVQTPIAFSTQNAPMAFHYVEPGEYDRPAYAYNESGPPPAPSVYYGGYPYPYPYYYPYWGPSVGFFWGGGGYYGRGYYGGGFRGGRFYDGPHGGFHGGAGGHR
jgi:hypothetical protein